jgi:hypothetical protein
MIDTSWISGTSNFMTGTIGWLMNGVIWFISQIGFVEVCIIVAIVMIVYVWSQTIRPQNKPKFNW